MVTLTEQSKQLWRMDDPELDDTGQVITGGMWEHQREWWELPNFIRLLVAGYGAGKTMPLCKRMIALALINGDSGRGSHAGAPVGLVSPTYPMARETTMTTLSELLQGKATVLRNFTWKHNKNTNTFHVIHGGRHGRILVYSGLDPIKLKGPNLSAVGIDEPFIQDEGVFHQMIARVRHPLAKKKEINLTGTPEQLNWGYKLAKGKLGKNHDVGIVHASTRANRALESHYADRLEGTFDDLTAQAFVGGQFVNLSQGATFYAFDEKKHVKQIPRPNGSALCLGMDFNVNPMAFLTAWREYDPSLGQVGRVHILRDFELPNSDTEDACSLVKSIYPELTDCYPDPACKQRATNAPGGKTDAAFIHEAGMTVHAPNKHDPIRDTINAVNGAFKNNRLTIDPCCEKLIEYLSTHTWENANTDHHKAMGHLLSALRYLVAYLMPVGKQAVTSEVFF